MSPFAIWRRQLVPLAATAIATAILPVIVVTVSSVLVPNVPPPMLIAVAALTLYTQSIAGTAAAWQVAEHRAGRPPLVRRALARAASRWAALALLGLIMTISFAGAMFGVGVLAILVAAVLPFVPAGASDTVIGPGLITGMVCWIPLGFTLMCSWPVLATEDTSAIGAIKRSLVLLQGRWAKTMASLAGPFVFGLLPFGVLVSLSAAHLDVPEWLITVSGLSFCVASCVTMQLFTCASTLRLLDAGLAGGSVQPVRRVQPVQAVQTRPAARSAFAGLGANPWFQFLLLAALISGGITLYNVVTTNADRSVLAR